MTDDDSGSLLDALAALEPHLSAKAKREARALDELRRLFPGETLSQITKSIEALLKASRGSPPALARRSEALVAGSAQESADEIVRDARSLTTADLAKLGQRLGITLNGKKADRLAQLERYLASGGRERPASATERAEAQATRYVDAATPHLARVDPAGRARLHEITDQAYKDRSLGKAGFLAYARGLGVSPAGTKAQTKKMLGQWIDRLAVSHDQTRF